MNIVNKSIQKSSISFPGPLIERLDAARGDVSRSRFLQRILEAHLDGGAPPPAKVDRVPWPAAVPQGLTKPHAGQWGGIGGRPPIQKGTKR